MFKIGIIGTENSHALAFSEIINLPDQKTGKLKYEDARIVGVYGPDMKSAENIKKVANVDFIANKPEDFIGKVDAMMITSRKGSVHYEYALPFIKQGIPLFIDKPITVDNNQALDIVMQAKKHNTLITGGSGCKYAFNTIDLKNDFNSMVQNNMFRSASVNFSVEANSIYDGFFFYSSHLTEIALTIFGYDMKSVNAFEKNGTVVVVAHYDDYDVTLHFTDASSVSSCVLYGKTKNIYREIDISSIYDLEVEKFITMLRTKKMPHSFDEIIKPVFVINAILKSLETKQEIII